MLWSGSLIFLVLFEAQMPFWSDKHPMYLFHGVRSFVHGYTSVFSRKIEYTCCTTGKRNEEEKSEFIGSKYNRRWTQREAVVQPPMVLPFSGPEFCSFVKDQISIDLTNGAYYCHLTSDLLPHGSFAQTAFLKLARGMFLLHQMIKRCRKQNYLCDLWRGGFATVSLDEFQALTSKSAREHPWHNALFILSLHWVKQILPWHWIVRTIASSNLRQWKTQRINAKK